MTIDMKFANGSEMENTFFAYFLISHLTNSILTDDVYKIPLFVQYFQLPYGGVNEIGKWLQRDGDQHPAKVFIRLFRDSPQMKMNDFVFGQSLTNHHLSGLRFLHHKHIQILCRIVTGILCNDLIQMLQIVCDQIDVEDDVYVHADRYEMHNFDQHQWHIDVL